LAFKLEQMRMDFQYSSKYRKSSLPEAYERLLLECLAADHSHFVSSEELLASWRIFTPALRQMQADLGGKGFGGEGVYSR
ncbi:MAG: hypothetical protein SGPRY_012874, partial [Prymnesium sp.]